MPLVTFYFQLHQPFRLKPDNGSFLWDEENKKVFLKVAEKCYIPATRMFIDLIVKNPDFKITFSMSGTFLEQAELYQPELIVILQKLFDAGRENNQVEFLDETYYHSLVSLFGDPKKREFREQVDLHRNKIKDVFGLEPTSFRNTELMYNNEIAETVADMGYCAMLCEKRNDMYKPQDGKPVSPNAVFRAKGTRLIAVPRNRELSDDVAFRFPCSPISPEQYAESLARVDGEAILLGYDYEHIGEHIWTDKGIFDFWKALPSALAKYPNIVATNPTEIAEQFGQVDCPEADIHGLSTSSWADAGRNTFGWLGNKTQYAIFKRIEMLGQEVLKMSGKRLEEWRHLTTSDHLYFLHEGSGDDHAVHNYFNPYDGSISAATYVLTDRLTRLENHVRRFEVLEKKEKTAVLIISPETARLPEGMGELAKYISGKSGGQGEVVSALCEGMFERGIEVYIAIPNLKKRFMRESELTPQEWRNIRHKTDPGRVFLVSSPVFDNKQSIYEGDPRVSAAAFQTELVNNVIKNLMARHEGKIILVTNDWMAGGAVTAYAKSRGIPLVHFVHNIFTGHIPLESLFGVDIRSMSHDLYFSREHRKECVDSQTTAIKNAARLIFPGVRFMQELDAGYFSDKVPWNVREEFKVKYRMGLAEGITNMPSPIMYPENNPHLDVNFCPKDDLLATKQYYLIQLQKEMGLLVDPNAILFFWPSRLDPTQKGVELLEDIALRFVRKHERGECGSSINVQIAIVADPVEGDIDHWNRLVDIALKSNGKISVFPFNERSSIFGYAAANDVFGASLYEPCGQIDQIANLFGATATNRDTGGYHDKIKPLELKIWHAPLDSGNGFLFKNYLPDALEWAMDQSVKFHRLRIENPVLWVEQIRRIMKEARIVCNLDRMVIPHIEQCILANNGKPLV